ncbi:protein nedd1 [Stylonychia lemnae]|uniref:Protein nedd1 n=1 Tax=Stylonychia lemnae TaxID=5949 RepID=A0A078B673_STYLE|nr:protein nedd1 [Stylonychia lemnae]|eukprot:CDW89033.1 protein nedd1 [Stylonychia lemnae]
MLHKLVKLRVQQNRQCSQQLTKQLFMIWGLTCLFQQQTIKEVGTYGKLTGLMTHKKQFNLNEKNSQGVVISSICYSQDSSFIAYCCSDGTLGIFNLKTKKPELFHDNGHMPGIRMISVSINQNDQLLASASADGIICIRHLQGEQKVMQFHEIQRVTVIQFSHVKANILATAHENGKVCVFDASTAQKKCEFENAHQQQVTGLAFSPVNNLLLCSCGLDGKIQFFDIQGVKNVKTIDNQNPLTAISFCFDGHTIAVGSLKGKIYVYDLKDKQKIKNELKGQDGKRINCLQFMRNPEKFANSPSSTSYFQSTAVNIRSSQEKIAVTTAKDAQNLSGIKGVPRPPTATTKSSNNSVAGSRSKENTPLSQQKLNKSGNSLNSQQSQNMEEKTIRYIEEQKVNNAQFKIQEQLEKLQQTFEQSKQALNLGTSGNQSQQQQQLPINKINLNQLGTESQANKLGKIDKYARDIGGNNTIREDDELMEELSLKRRNSRPTHLSHETKVYIDKVFQDQAEQIKMSIQQSISNLHIELIRNFTIQENELRMSLGDLLERNKRKKQELRYLRKENKKLRQITY